MYYLKQITTEELSHEVSEIETAVVAVFYSAGTNPCRILSEMLDHFATAFGNEVRFVKINCDTHPHATEQYELHDIPTMLLFHHGQLVDRISGTPSPTSLKCKLDSLTINQAGQMLATAVV